MWVSEAITLAVLLGAVAMPIRAVRRRRRDERRIRDWAREKGYAIMNIRYGGHVFGAFARIGLPGGPRHWRVQIQDDQGGQTTVSIYMRSPDAPLDIRWG